MNRLSRRLKYTGSDPAHGQRWYEVVDYMNGPLANFTSTNIVINGKVWGELPPDLRQIIMEEGAKSESEALRLAAAQNDTANLRNTMAGLEFVQFSPELVRQSFEVAGLRHVIPNWIKKAGGVDSEAVQIFISKVAPFLNITIDSRGNATVIK